MPTPLTAVFADRQQAMLAPEERKRYSLNNQEQEHSVYMGTKQNKLERNYVKLSNKKSVIFVK